VKRQRNVNVNGKSNRSGGYFHRRKIDVLSKTVTRGRTRWRIAEGHWNPELHDFQKNTSDS
jgi:hypothetical protein